MLLLFKNTIIKIRKSIGRFLSILFIVALGISVFIGLRESTAGMLYTADNYYDENNLMDFKIISTYGLTTGDLKALQNLENIGKVIPSYSIDVLDNGESIRVHAIENSINNVILKEGKMPKNNNECLGDYYKYEVGDVIKFERKDLKDFLSINKCRVVGTIKSVLYIRDEKGISNIGNGKLISYIYVKKSAFTSKYYTEIYLTMKEIESKNSYYVEYENELSKLQSKLEELKPIRETIRYEEILEEASNEIAKAQKELYDNVTKIEEKLNSTKKLLDSSLVKLNSLENDLNDSLTTLNKTKSEKELEFKNYFNVVESSKLEINNVLSGLGLTYETLLSTINNLKINIEALEKQLSELEEATDEYNAVLNELNSLKNRYNALLEIKNNYDKIVENEKDLNNNYTKFKDEIKTNLDKINDGLAKIETERTKVEKGYQEYNEAIQKVTSERKKAEDKIADAKEELENIEKPVWYLLDRTDNSGYISYKEDVIKVEAISKTLPIFFIIVVMLMCLNTLSRLIEEERTEIGILQAIGYSNIRIAFGYLLYVIIAALSGITIGLTVGYSIIPKIIYGVFLSRYYVPKLITIINPLPFSLVIIVTLLIMVMVTMITCYKELRAYPAAILRPKSPKSGKKVFLENVNFIWSRLNFTKKVTVRNLFRYKKRIIMTVLGVAGCTALLLTGFGLNDSINKIAKLQYGKIIKYDAMFILDEKENKIDEKLLALFKKNNISNPLLINQTAYTFNFNNKTEDVYLVVAEDNDKLKNYINLNSILTNSEISILSYGAIITEQMADLLNVKKGDTVKIRNSDNELYILLVLDIVENYTSHYIYIDKSYYKEIFKKNIEFNTIITNIDKKLDSSIPLTDYNILLTNYTDDILKSFDSFVKGLNKIIYLVVICACFLALIVLYNLTIINVAERKREIATLKVLGFNDKEISDYVYRETIILTIMGIIFGLILGVFLHKFIIGTAQTDNILFIKKIKFVSFLLSGMITIIFSMLVQIIISRTLKKIDMIESLKSVE